MAIGSLRSRLGRSLLPPLLLLAIYRGRRRVEACRVRGRRGLVGFGDGGRRGPGRV